MNKSFFGLNCYKKDKLIGSLIMLYYNDCGYIVFNVSNRKFREFRPNDLLYWKTIKSCIKKGLKHVDILHGVRVAFGRRPLRRSGSRRHPAGGRRDH